MLSRHRWVTALLATLYITLVLWTERTGASAAYLGDLLGSLAAAGASVAVGWWIGGRLTGDADRRSIIALIVGMWAPLSATVQLMLSLQVHPAFESSLLAALAWTAACGLLIALVRRGGSDLAFTSRVLAFATAFLVVTQTVRVIGLARADAVEREIAASRPAGTPDVYVIVLDKYASGAWLRHTYGVEHAPFEDSLRALGFAVPRAARANYAHTHLALASFLNWRYLDVATDGVGGAPWGRTRELISESRTWSTFKARGYRLYTFPTWYTATNGIEGVDAVLRWPGRRDAVFAETWWVNAPFAPLMERDCRPPTCRPRAVMPYPVETLEEQEWKLEALATLPQRPGPVLAFLHLLVPHEPYLFADDCTPVEPWWPSTDQGESYDQVGQAYAAQVRCFAPRLLRAIRRIIETSKEPPVIIVQSDHGHARIFTNLLRGFTLGRDEMDDERLGERFGVFAAYRFPGADTLVHDDISPVNVMPLVMHSLWGAPRVRLPDRSYWSSYQEAFDLTEVPKALTVPPTAR